MLVRRLAARIYGGVMDVRNRRFDAGVGVHRVPRPVISVGNLSVGGTGKTPMVRWIAESLAAAGRRPAIVTRGYGARPGETADEVMEYREAIPDLPIFVGPDRVAVVGRALPDHPDVDCLVMDDGFQHRRLHRDLDLVLIAAHEPPDPHHVLPAGRLRESPHGLRRADAVIVTGTHALDPDLAARIEHFHGSPPLAWCGHAWAGATLIDAEGRREVSIDWLHGRRLVVRLGIGSPETVRRQLRVLGAEIVIERSARDHQPFSQTEAEFFQSVLDADAILMTAKDWVKARAVLDLRSLQVPIVVPQLDLRFLDGEQALTQLIHDTVSTSREADASEDHS